MKATKIFIIKSFPYLYNPYFSYYKHRNNKEFKVKFTTAGPDKMAWWLILIDPVDWKSMQQAIPMIQSGLRNQNNSPHSMQEKVKCPDFAFYV